MNLVAVTMLHEHDESRRELRDAIDVRWSRFLTRCGLMPLFVPNDPDIAPAMLRDYGPVGVLLTGGGNCSALSGIQDDRDRTEAVVLDWATANRRPVLGVCRGMQVLLTREGCRLQRVEGHAGRDHPVHSRNGSRTVNSYHDYAFLEVPDHYFVEARADDGLIEAVSWFHQQRWGIMWHPERCDIESPADVMLFRSIFASRSPSSTLRDRSSRERLSQAYAGHLDAETPDAPRT